MSKINTTTTIFPLLNRVEEQAKKCKTLETAAQAVTEVLYQEFSDSIVLARLFVTVPFGKLPAANRSFVTQLANTQGLAGMLKDETLVLSLLATRGRKPTWNDRRQSQGHVGIPLVSAAFIDRIPTPWSWPELFSPETCRQPTGCKEIERCKSAKP